MSTTTGERPSGRLLDTKAAAAYLGYSKNQIHQLVHRGLIPHMKVGAALRFDINALDRWIEDAHEKANRKANQQADEQAS